MKLLDDMITRIDAIDQKDHVCVNSCAVLFKEFLRRLTYVYDRSETDVPFTVNFYLPLIANINETEELVKNVIKPEHYSRFGNGAYFLIHAWIYWELNKMSLSFYSSISTVDLYEPIIRLLERGGRIEREKGFFEVCNKNMFSIKKVYSESPFISDMSEDHLNALD